MTETLVTFIKEYTDEYSWKRYPNHFYVWVPFYELESFCKLLPWGMTDYNLLDNCVLFQDCVCVDLCGVFSRKEIENFFPHNG